ncbi:hypothetical protein DASC09_062730 [Saccharomycopsis crataegensis]|uniref:Uncharacterized protein n=1 Tax=Saccharomycopsis crataegensis TaxID=43959 RepID=A0AAV5QW53_9ASCO|nr:hypothetical protein DASC09_062730 [Saccharomycopsis crataegensis]
MSTYSFSYIRYTSSSPNLSSPVLKYLPNSNHSSSVMTKSDLQRASTKTSLTATRAPLMTYYSSSPSLSTLNNAACHVLSQNSSCNNLHSLDFFNITKSVISTTLFTILLTGMVISSLPNASMISESPVAINFGSLFHFLNDFNKIKSSYPEQYVEVGKRSVHSLISGIEWDPIDNFAMELNQGFIIIGGLGLLLVHLLI